MLIATAWAWWVDMSRAKPASAELSPGARSVGVKKPAEVADAEQQGRDERARDRTSACGDCDRRLRPGPASARRRCVIGCEAVSVRRCPGRAAWCRSR